jgi:hypothetical protein
MATVWAIQEGHDFSKASVYGGVKVMFTGKINVFASDALVHDIEEKLKEAEEDDFLILSGTAIANCIAYSTLLKKFARVNILIYSHKHDDYEARTIRDGK